MVPAHTNGYCFPRISGAAEVARPRTDRPEADFRRVALGGLPPECRPGLAAGAGEAAAVPETPTIEDIAQQAYCRGFGEGERSGFEQGEKAGAAAAERELSRLKEGLLRLLAELEDLHCKSCREMEGELVDLALAVARKITRHELNTRPETVAATLREVLSQVAHATRVTVRMNPEDLKRLSGPEAQPCGDSLAAAQARFEADPTLTPGGFLVETDLGDLDARIERQFQAVEEAFRREWSAPTGS
jgi:flagellar biosynthesis/type III secretory pathway protein FliH